MASWLRVWQSILCKCTLIDVKYIYLTITTILLLLFLLFGTSPRDVSSALLVAPFVLIFITLFLVVAYFFTARGFTKRLGWTIATFFALLPTLLLVLQSIGQLTIRDVATIVALFMMAYFYTLRANNPAGRWASHIVSARLILLRWLPYARAVIIKLTDYGFSADRLTRSTYASTQYGARQLNLWNRARGRS